MGLIRMLGSLAPVRRWSRPKMRAQCGKGPEHRLVDRQIARRLGRERRVGTLERRR
jgi:hypothetical protein